MGSEVDQASPQPLVEDRAGFPGERHGSLSKPGNDMAQVIQNLKRLRSFEILGSAFTTFATNCKFMFLVLSSVVPLCAFMIFYEIKLQKLIEGIPNIGKPSVITLVLNYSGQNFYEQQQDNRNDLRALFFSNLLQLCLFYLVVYPLLEILSIVITVKFAAKIQSGDTQLSPKEALYETNFEGLLVTYVCVHLLSALTFLGLFWVVLNHHVFSARFWNPYGIHSIELYLNLVSIGLHSAIFMVLLYKYLEWSAFWNTSMVISVLEEETGIAAFGLSDYYGKHCKQTGFQLMLVFVGLGNVLRLPSLYFGLCNSSFAGVCVTAIVIGLVCLGNLVKWVAFVLYFHDCKQQVMEKKVDKDVCKAGDVC